VIYLKNYVPRVLEQKKFKEDSLMKNTRKKMLLSSVAMLLVALVALGAATYAWYSVQTTVTAEQSKFNASAASGLVIRHENDSYTGTDKATQTAWTTALNSENHNALKTASSPLPPRAITLYDGENGIAYDSVKGASAKATSRDSYKASTHSLINNVPNDGGYLVDHMYVAGEAGSENVTMTIRGTTAKAGAYLNVAVYIAGKLEKVFTFDNNATTRDLTVNGSTASEGATYTPVAFTGDYQEVKADFQVASKADKGTEIQIIAYVDGFNDNCKSSSYDVSPLAVDYSFARVGS
jgi:hypothetical protein